MLVGRIWSGIIAVNSLLLVAAAPSPSPTSTPISTPIPNVGAPVPTPFPTAVGTPVNASSIASPIANAPTPAAVMPLIIDTYINGGAPCGNQNSPCFVATGTTVMLTIRDPTGVASPLTYAVNGQDVSFPTEPLAFTADEAGTWNVRVDTPGYSSNTVTVIAR